MQNFSKKEFYLAIKPYTVWKSFMAKIKAKNRCNTRAAEELLLSSVTLVWLISVGLCSSSSTGCSILLIKYFLKPIDCMASFSTILHGKILLSEGREGVKTFSFYASNCIYHVIMR